MAIASVGTLGTAAEGASGDANLALTTSAALEAGNVGVLAIASDNAGATGNTNHHTSVTDSNSNTYTKIYEYTYSPGSTAADGVTVSIWVVRPGSDLASGSTVTMSQSANTAEKCASMWEYTSGAGLQKAGTQQTSGGTESHPASLAISGLTSKEYLFFRVTGKEVNTTTALTATTNFTAIDGTRSRNNSAAITIRGEFRILTGTGATSAPSMNVVCDTGSIFVALEEVAAGGTDALTATNITTGAPTLTAAVIGQVHALTSTNITTGAPSLTAPDIGKIHALESTDITTGAPTLSAPTLASVAGVNALTATDITTGAPTLSAAVIGQVHALASTNITTAAPTLTAPAIGQVHALTGTNITTGAPTLDAPTLASVAGVHDLIATNITTGAPTLTAPVIGQVHRLTANSITTGAPSLSAATLAFIDTTPAVAIVIGQGSLKVQDYVVMRYNNPGGATLLHPAIPTASYRQPGKGTLK